MNYISFKLWLAISHVLIHQIPIDSKNFKYDFPSSDSWCPCNGTKSTLCRGVASYNTCLMTTTPFHKNHINYNGCWLMTNKTTIVKLHRKIQQN
jgi:hypothetical protein